MLRPYRWCLLALTALLLSLVPASARSQTRVTPADSAAIVLEAARSFEAEGEWDVAEALYRYVLERWPASPSAEQARARLVGAPGEGGGRVELQVWSALYGLWLGVAVPGAFGADEPEPFGIGLLLGGPAGFFSGRALARSRDPSIGQARSITFGGTWGTWQGLGWAMVFDAGEGFVCELDFCYNEGSEEERFAAMIAGGLVGIASGALIARRPVSAGSAALVNGGALWGTWLGVASGIAIADMDGDDLLAVTLLAGNAGLAAAAAAAPRLAWSRNRTRLVSVAGVIGALGGFGVDLLLQPDGARAVMAIPLVTSLAGLALGVYTTRDYDAPVRAGDDQGGGGALLNVSRGRVRVDAPLPLPSLVPVDGPSGTSWRPALHIPLLRASF